MSFLVAAPYRSVTDNHAKVLAALGLLGGYFNGTRRGTAGIPGELTFLNPLFGLYTEATRKMFSYYQAEWLRTAYHPLFARWVALDAKPGMHVISSYGYLNYCYKKIKRGGGKVFEDAPNSHPINFWETIKEEHKRWKINRPPYPKHWNNAARESVELADYLFCPSQFVRNSFIDRGFSQDRLLDLPYPVDLSVYQPRTEVTIPDSPLRIVCTGSVSLRKGFPYLLEATRLIKKERDVVLVLTDLVEGSMKSILPKFSDVPIEWAPHKAPRDLAEHLKGAHVFALLSLEEGMVRTAMEAMACGVPVVLTPNTGTSDLVIPGVNGEVVPIRDPEAAARAIIQCHERQLKVGPPAVGDFHQKVSFSTFATRFMAHLSRIGFIDGPFDHATRKPEEVQL